MSNYKNIIAWQKGHILTLAVYKLTEDFPKSEIYGITNQIRRASYSVPSNIAEGAGRKTQPDFLKFLNIAYASLKEVEYFLLSSKDLGYLSLEKHIEITEIVNTTFFMLNKFINSVKSANFYALNEDVAEYPTNPIDPIQLPI